MTHSGIIRSVLLSAAVAIPALTSMESVAFATAGAGQAVHINADGRKVCRALARQPGTFWEAKIRGRFLDSYAGNNRFVIKTCFETRAQCLNFAGGIRHYVQGVEVVNYARCNEL